MNVYKCERDGGYSGGVIIVAANNVNEAFDTYVRDKRFDWMHWTETDENGNLIVSEFYYPLVRWEAVPELTANCSEPKVLIEAGYTE